VGPEPISRGNDQAERSGPAASTSGAPKSEQASGDARAECDAEFATIVTDALASRRARTPCGADGDCALLKFPDRSLASYQRRYDAGPSLGSGSKAAKPGWEPRSHDPIAMRGGSAFTELAARLQAYRSRCDSEPDVALPYEAEAFCDTEQSCERRAVGSQHLIPDMPDHRAKHRVHK
jgi:hypothetical protein